MTEPSVTADPVNTLGNSIEDDLSELDAILAEMNANAEPSGTDSEQEIASEAEPDASSAEQGQSVEAVATEASPVEADAEPCQDQNGQLSPEDVVEALHADTEDAAETPAEDDQEDAQSDPVAEGAVESDTQSTSDQADPEATEVEPSEVVPEAGQAPVSISPKPVLALATWVVWWPLVAVLTILDRPFAGISFKVKRILGYIAIATTMMAVAIWLLTDFIR